MPLGYTGSATLGAFQISPTQIQHLSDALIINRLEWQPEVVRSLGLARTANLQYYFLAWPSLVL
jgi:hypothetical protein